MNDPTYDCAACDWSGPRSQLIWSVPRRFICPECKSDKVHRSNDEIASLKTELAAALADIIEYRRMRYANSAPEEARYRQLTGHAYDDE